jgi:glucosamine 6-phosphate synthetase-like amidotransferase/phosphosugar isomerase protein
MSNNEKEKEERKNSSEWKTHGKVHQQLTHFQQSKDKSSFIHLGIITNHFFRQTTFL